MNLGAVFCVGNLTCSFHMLHTWPTRFYVGPPTSTFLATLVCTSNANSNIFGLYSKRVCVCVCVRSGRLVFGLFSTRMLYPSMQYSGILQ